jgi:hypothetical protein
MSSDLGTAVNRLTGETAGGDEPDILGITAEPRPATDGAIDVDAAGESPEAVAAFVDESLLAALQVRGALAELLEEWDGRIHRGVPRHVLRREISHVSRETGDLYDLNEFERSLNEEIDQLVWICVRPLQDLRYEEVIQPVGRVRRPARGAAQQLSAHSEQWERWAPDFPIPKEILASIREDDTDLYENRVARTLVSGSLVHLNRRLQQLRSHLTKNVQGRLVLLTGWHWRQERLRSSFDAQDVDTVIEMLELAVAELESMAARLAPLAQSPLFQGTAPRGRVHSLQITNVLRRDARYRRLPALWQLWSSTQDDDAQSQRRLDDPSVSQRGMDVLTEVLSAKALDWLGFVLDPSSGQYRKGNSQITFTESDGAIQLTIADAAGTRTVRLVGLATPLQSGDQPDPLLRARLLDRWLNEHSEEVGPLAVLHPTEAADITIRGHRDRTLIDHTGLDDVEPGRTWSVIPASPLLVDTPERVTRFLRWHLTAPLYERSVMRIACGELDRNDRKTLENLTSCRLDGRELVVERPWAQSDRELLAAMTARRPSGWLAAVDSVDALHDALLQCPVYPTHGRAGTHFDRRSNGTFVCRCTRCRSEWGTNICGSCGATIPFLRPGKAVPDGQNPSDFFGGDLLASLCEGAPASDVQPVESGPDLRVLICPKCRECSKSSRYRECGRCAEHEG